MILLRLAALILHLVVVIEGSSSSKNASSIPFPINEEPCLSMPSRISISTKVHTSSPSTGQLSLSWNTNPIHVAVTHNLPTVAHNTNFDKTLEIMGTPTSSPHERNEVSREEIDFLWKLLAVTVDFAPLSRSKTIPKSNKAMAPKTTSRIQRNAFDRLLHDRRHEATIAEQTYRDIWSHAIPEDQMERMISMMFLDDDLSNLLPNRNELDAVFWKLAEKAKRPHDGERVITMTSLQDAFSFWLGADLPTDELIAHGDILQPDGELTMAEFVQLFAVSA